MVEVHGFTLRALPVDIDENKFVANVLVEHRVGVAHPDKSGADQNHLSCFQFHCHLSYPVVSLSMSRTAKNRPGFSHGLTKLLKGEYHKIYDIPED